MCLCVIVSIFLLCMACILPCMLVLVLFVFGYGVPLNDIVLISVGHCVECLRGKLAEIWANKRYYYSNNTSRDKHERFLSYFRRENKDVRKNRFRRSDMNNGG